MWGIALNASDVRAASRTSWCGLNLLEMFHQNTSGDNTVFEIDPITYLAPTHVTELSAFIDSVPDDVKLVLNAVT